VKRCSTCKIDKPVKEFYANRTRADDLAHECKTCCAARKKTPQARAQQSAYERERGQRPERRASVRKYNQSEAGRAQRRAYRQRADVKARLRASAAAYRRTPERLAYALARDARRKAEAKARLKELKDAPCIDCGATLPPEYMHYDHRDPATKLGNVSRMALRGQTRRMETEIAKCDLVCLGCHLQRTTRRRAAPAHDPPAGIRVVDEPPPA
jgi:hypothetical protein